MVLLLLALILPWIALPQSVSHVRTIDFKASQQKGKLAKFLFGGKKVNPVKPASIFLVNDNLLGVIDQVNGQVVFSDMKGKIRKRIRKVGKISFSSPVSGCSVTEGFYVSDSSLRSIFFFSDQLRFLRVFFSDPAKRITGIAHFGDRLFCVDTENHKIVVLSAAGEVLSQFGRRGTGMGEFNFPTHVAVDKDHIYVTDAMNFRVQIFDHNGGFVRMFGKNGKKGGDFSKPKGIAVDSKKRLFVSDSMFDNVQVFDMNGRFLSYFGGPGHDTGQFWMPSGIMIDKDDRIYIADTFNSRVQIFRVKGEER